MPINTVRDVCFDHTDVLRMFADRKILEFHNFKNSYQIKPNNIRLTRLREELRMKRDFKNLEGLMHWEMMMEQPSDAAALYAHMSMFHHGLKVFRPTPYQCEMLSRVELNIARQDYVQPYPSLVIEWPEKFKERLHQLFPHLILPKGMQLFWEQGHFMLCVAIEDKSKIEQFIKENPGVMPNYGAVFSMNIKDDETPIESWLVSCNPIDQRSAETMDQMDWDSGRFMQRTALNLAMFLADQKFFTDCTVDVAKLSAVAKDGSRGKRSRREAEQTINEAGALILLHDQNIKLHDVEHGARDVSTGETEFASIRPHYRKGHRRTLIPGEGKPWKERKVVFVKAVLVNQHKMTGEEINTTIYRG